MRSQIFYLFVNNSIWMLSHVLNNILKTGKSKRYFLSFWAYRSLIYCCSKPSKNVEEGQQEMRWWIKNPFNNLIYCCCCSHVSAKFSFPYANECFLSVLCEFHVSDYICLSQNCTYRVLKYSQKLILQSFHILHLVPLF